MFVWSLIVSSASFFLVHSFMYIGFKDENTENSVESGSEEDKNGANSTKFRLVGILVHSGQASGGHYYSYVLQR